MCAGFGQSCGKFQRTRPILIRDRPAIWADFGRSWATLSAKDGARLRCDPGRKDDSLGPPVEQLPVWAAKYSTNKNKGDLRAELCQSHGSNSFRAHFRRTLCLLAPTSVKPGQSRLTFCQFWPNFANTGRTGTKFGQPWPDLVKLAQTRARIDQTSAVLGQNPISHPTCAQNLLGA